MNPWEDAVLSKKKKYQSETIKLEMNNDNDNKELIMAYRIVS